MNKSSRFASRLRLLATISFANVVVIYTTLFSDWTLREAALAYVGEWLILLLVICARFAIANRFPGEPLSSRPWPLLYAKSVNILITLLFNGVFIFLMSFLLLGGVDLNLLPDATWRALAWCWAAFLVSHGVDFIDLARLGAYDELIDDRGALAHLWRYLAVLPAAIAVAGERNNDAPVVPWFFVAALVLMAAIDVGIYVADLDAAQRRLRSRAPAAGPV